MNDVTCFTLYYGRKALAEEAVECFLRQTHPHKRLVIVNTHPDTLYFKTDYENIEVHNKKASDFRNLNEKYNYALSQIKTKWFCPWDSDDLWLPWHLENLIANIPMQRNIHPMKIGYPMTLFSLDNRIKKLGWQMWADCIFERRGKIHCDANKTMNCDRQIVFKNKWNRYWLRLKDYPKPSFIFRRFSAADNASLWLGQKGQEFVRQLYAREAAKPIKEPMRPHWDRDYVKDADDFMDMLRASHYNTKHILKNPRKIQEVNKVIAAKDAIEQHRQKARINKT